MDIGLAAVSDRTLVKEKGKGKGKGKGDWQLYQPGMHNRTQIMQSSSLNSALLNSASTAKKIAKLIKIEYKKTRAELGEILVDEIKITRAELGVRLADEIGALVGIEYIRTRAEFLAIVQELKIELKKQVTIARLNTFTVADKLSQRLKKLERAQERDNIAEIVKKISERLAILERAQERENVAKIEEEFSERLKNLSERLAILERESSPTK